MDAAGCSETLAGGEAAEELLAEWAVWADAPGVALNAAEGVFCADRLSPPWGVELLLLLDLLTEEDALWRRALRRVELVRTDGVVARLERVLSMVLLLDVRASVLSAKSAGVNIRPTVSCSCGMVPLSAGSSWLKST